MGSLKNTKITILGGGNIGMSIAAGLIKSGQWKASDLTITRIASQPLTDIVNMGINATHDNKKALKDADFVFFAVQPRQAVKVFEDVKEALNPKKHNIISVVTALSFADIEKVIGKGFSLTRIMPNTAISICESMTCMASNDTESEMFKKAQGLFNHLGKTLIIEEKMMAAATVLASCGTAFMMRFIRAAAQGGIQVGFHASEAQDIVAQVAKGAACLLMENGQHPEQEIDKVTTPMGLTIKGLNEMEHNGLSSAVIKGIVHSYNEMEKIK